MTTVIVVEPHALLRLGMLRHLTEVFSEYQFQGVDFSFLSGQACPGSKSDLVLLSVARDENVCELVLAAERTYSPNCVLLLSDIATMPESWRDLPPVVAGYVSKSASPDLLVASIRLMLVGGRCFPPSQGAPTFIAKGPSAQWVASKPRALDSLSCGASDVNAPSLHTVAKTASMRTLADIEAQMLRITPRQYQVLVLLSHGNPIKMVSRHLNISIATAKAHTEMLYQRLDAHNKNEAVYTAVSRGATLGWQRLESA